MRPIAADSLDLHWVYIAVTLSGIPQSEILQSAILQSEIPRYAVTLGHLGCSQPLLNHPFLAPHCGRGVEPYPYG